MASFDENGKYIKTNWKAGDKITATKLNKIEESIEAVNDNDISRHVEADARLDALEAKDVAHDKEFTNVKNLIEDAKDAAELGDYEINSRMQFLEQELNEGIEEVHNVASTVDGKIAQGKADMEAMVAEVEADLEGLHAEVEADLEGLHAKDEELSVQLEHNTNKLNALNNYLYELSLLTEQDDCSVILQEALDNYGYIELPPGKKLYSSNQILLNKRTVIKGNNATIYYSNGGALFKHNGCDIISVYDLDVRIYDDSGFIDMNVPDGTGANGCVRTNNVNVFGNSENTFGIYMRKNDFSKIENTKFWYLKEACVLTAGGDHSSTQIVFDNVGTVSCELGFYIEYCDKVTFSNVDVARGHKGFELGNQCQRVLFLNCHAEYYEYGFYIPSNNLNKFILFENCSVKLPKSETSVGFYVGEYQAWGAKDLRFINCGWESFDTNLVYDIRSPFILEGSLPDYYNFIKKSGNALLDSKLEFNKYITDDVFTVDLTTDNFFSNGSGTYSVSGGYGGYAIEPVTVMYGTVKLSKGTYVLTIEGYSENIVMYCQRQSDWVEFFSDVKLYTEPRKQTLIFEVDNEDEKTFRIGIRNWYDGVNIAFFKRITISKIYF